MLFLFLFMHFQAMIPGLEVVTHHTLVITHRFPTSLRNAKTFQLLLTSICELCTVSKKCLYNENKSNPSFGPLNCHHTEFIQVTTTSWPSTWSPFHNLARTALVQMGSMNFFLWTRSWIEFRGMFFLNQEKKFQSSLPTLNGYECQQKDAQRFSKEASPRHLTSTSWVPAEGGLIRAAQPLLALIQLFKTRPRRFKECDLQLLWTSISFMWPHIPLSNRLTPGKSRLSALKSVCSSSNGGRDCVPLLSWQVTHKTEQA